MTRFEQQRCPDCAAGKHEACDGTAWNLVTDQPEWCICAGFDHDPRVLKRRAEARAEARRILDMFPADNSHVFPPEEQP